MHSYIHTYTHTYIHVHHTMFFEYRYQYTIVQIFNVKPFLRNFLNIYNRPIWEKKETKIIRKWFRNIDIDIHDDNELSTLQVDQSKNSRVEIYIRNTLIAIDFLCFYNAPSFRRVSTKSSTKKKGQIEALASHHAIRPPLAPLEHLRYSYIIRRIVFAFYPG